MAFVADHEILFGRLDEELRSARKAAAPDVFYKIIACVCRRIPVLLKTGNATRIDQLIGAGAWTDGALALLQLELPEWQVRRLAFENGEWLCSLSRQPNLPATLDDSIDVVHAVLPLAILRAFLEAQQASPAAGQIVADVPRLQPTIGHPICCDNFA
jgi:hypothetical protein